MDLYAGTGAVGIEALSRGALRAIFVEQHPPAVTLIRRNLESLKIGAEAEVLGVDAARAIEGLAPREAVLAARLGVGEDAAGVVARIGDDQPGPENREVAPQPGGRDAIVGGAHVARHRHRGGGRDALDLA